MSDRDRYLRDFNEALGFDDRLQGNTEEAQFIRELQDALYTISLRSDEDDTSAFDGISSRTELFINGESVGGFSRESIRRDLVAREARAARRREEIAEELRQQNGGEPVPESYYNLVVARQGVQESSLLEDFDRLTGFNADPTSVSSGIDSADEAFDTFEYYTLGGWTTDNFLADGNNSDGEEFSGEQAIRAIFRREQCVLSAITENIYSQGVIDRTLNHIIQIDDPEIPTIISRLNGRPQVQKWFNLDTPTFSLIVPRVVLYKQTYRINSNGDYQELEEDIIRRYEFTNNISESRINQITGLSSGREGGVGIKSFNVKTHGTNPEETRTFLEAELSISIQDLADLFPPGFDYDNPESFQVVSPEENNMALIELIYAGTERDRISQQYNPNFFRIKVQIGWTLNDYAAANLFSSDINLDEVRSIIEATNNIMYLNLFEHNIEFSQDASLTLNLRYGAYLDQVFRDDRTNILTIPGSNRIDAILELIEAEEQARTESFDINRRQAEQNRCEGITENTPSDDDPMPSGLELTRRELLLADINSEDNIFNNYNAIFNTLLEKGRIYGVQLDQELIYEDIRTRGAERLGEFESRQGTNNISLNNASDDRDDDRLERRLRIEQDLLTRTSLANADVRIAQLSNQGIRILQRDFAQTIEQEAGQVAENIQEQLDEDYTATTTEAAAQGFDDFDVTPFVSSTTDDGRYYQFYFMRLGDILDVVIEKLKLNGQISSLFGLPPEAYPTFISGPYIYMDINKARKMMNMMDILVSYQSFKAFFVENVIRSLRTIYPLRDFIVDMVTKFGYENSVAGCFDTDFVPNVSRPSMQVFSSPRLSNGEEKITGLWRQAAQSIAQNTPLFNSNAPAGDNVPAPIINNLSALLDYRQEGSILDGTIDPRNLANYFAIYSYNIDVLFPPASDNGTVNLELLDALRGVYHLKIGHQRSVIKDIKFTKSDIRGFRESRLVNSGAMSLQYLREVYDASITLVGAPFIEQGQHVYLDPTLVGLGAPNSARSAARFLGLGGYYFINNVIHDIKGNGVFETRLEAIWTSFGDEDFLADICRITHPIIISPNIDFTTNIEITSDVEESVGNPPGERSLVDVAQDFAIRRQNNDVGAPGTNISAGVVLPPTGRGGQRNF